MFVKPFQRKTLHVNRCQIWCVFSPKIDMVWQNNGLKYVHMVAYVLPCRECGCVQECVHAHYTHMLVCVHLTPSRHRSSRPGVRWRRHGEGMEQGMGSRGERASRCWDCFFFKRKFLLTSFIDWEHMCVCMCVCAWVSQAQIINQFSTKSSLRSVGNCYIFMHISKSLTLSCK